MAPERTVLPLVTQAFKATSLDFIPEQEHRPVEDIYKNVGHGETAYEATFEDLARTQSSSFAHADANILFYVIDPTRLQRADWSVQDVLTPLVLSLLGAAVVFGAIHLKTWRRARLKAIPLPA